MGDIRIADLPGHSLEAVCHAQIERSHSMARAADDVMMVMLAGVELIAIGAIAKIAPAHERDFLHRRQTTVNGDQIAHAAFHAPMQFFRRKGAMLARQYLKDRLPRLGDTVMVVAQSLQRAVELRVGGGM